MLKKNDFEFFPYLLNVKFNISPMGNLCSLSATPKFYSIELKFCVREFLPKCNQKPPVEQGKSKLRIFGTTLKNHITADFEHMLNSRHSYVLGYI